MQLIDLICMVVNTLVQIIHEHAHLLFRSYIESTITIYLLSDRKKSLHARSHLFYPSLFNVTNLIWQVKGSD